jgi:MFS family permease
MEGKMNAMSLLLPLALAQFICTYAVNNMNVAISIIASDLGTTVYAVQVAITLFTLTMAALMITGSKLASFFGCKVCFILGLTVYGAGALIAALSPMIGILILGYSILEGIGSALLIPPIYILATISYSGIERAKAFGIISAAAGIGAALGPLLGGIIITALSWQASFIFQVLVVLFIIFLSRKISNVGIKSPRPRFDYVGAIFSALAMFFIVFSFLITSQYGWLTATKDFSIGSILIIPKGGISPFWLLLVIGLIFLGLFFFFIYRKEQKGKEPLISLRLFQKRASNLGLLTQLSQWAVLQGTAFVISVFLQTVRGFNAIQTGLMLTPATIGLMLSSMLAGRMASRRSQKTLIIWGFAVTIIGILLLLLLARASSSIWTFVPGLFLIGIGVGVMLTSSVNVVQSSFLEQDQSDISGLSRSISNFGSSLGTSLAGSILIIALTPQNKTYVLAMVVLVGIALIGLLASIFIPKKITP